MLASEAQPTLLLSPAAQGRLKHAVGDHYRARLTDLPASAHRTSASGSARTHSSKLTDVASCTAYGHRCPSHAPDPRPRRPTGGVAGGGGPARARSSHPPPPTAGFLDY